MILQDKIAFRTKDFSPRKTKKDFIDYCTDLHKIESGFLQFSEKTGFSFSELLELWLVENSAMADWFLTADVIVVAHETYEYDPDYSHIVAYILNRFKLSSEVLAISGSKKHLLDNAKHILSAYLLADHQVGLIIEFEQAVLPFCINKQVKLPAYSAVSVFRFAAHLRQETR